MKRPSTVAPGVRHPAALRWASGLVRFGQIYPLALLLSFYASWTLARWRLGHWPRPLLDDPASLGAPVQSCCGWIGILMVVGLPLSLVLHGAWVLLYMAEPGVRAKRMLIAELVALALLMFAVWFLRSDPGGMVTWYFD